MPPTSLELYLVRHAVAAERGPQYPDDALRPLTPGGARKFARAVAGLERLGVTLDVVMTSPLARARQTADLLVAGLRPRPALVEIAALAPGRPAGGVLAAVAEASAAARRSASRVAVVGHEPDLGVLAARLLGARGTFEFRKGAVCHIDLERAMPQGPGTLRWWLPPRVLRGLAR